MILATSKQMCLRKLAVVNEFCTESGMVISEKKKIFVISGEQYGKQSLASGEV